MSKKKDGSYTQSKRGDISVTGELKDRFQKACDERKVKMGPTLDKLVNDALDKL